MSEFKDLFSKQSGDYAKFRPTYPPELFQYLAEISSDKKACWDAGTGNGQAAVELSKYFDKVYASDPSEKQISEATKNPKIEYFVGSAENSKLENESVSLITVAQAFHWFKHDLFLAEAKRVLKPKGHIAVWTYAMAVINPAIDKLVMDLYLDILGDYWEKERKLVETGYSSIHYSIPEIKTPKFQMQAEWSVEHLLGYLNTWSALQTYIKKHSRNPVTEMIPAFQKAWGEGSKKVTWDLSLRVWQS